MSALTQKGQVTVPKAVRQLLGLQTGDEVEFVVREGYVELKRAGRGHVSAYGILRPKRTMASGEKDDASALMDVLLEDDDRSRAKKR